MSPRTEPLRFCHTLACFLIAFAICTVVFESPQACAQDGGVAIVPLGIGGNTDPYGNTVPASGWFSGGAIGQLRQNGSLIAGPMMLSERLWVRAEYMHWWTEGMELPPLVTTSPAGTVREDAAVLGEPGTSILFGNGRINDDSVSGVRLKTGFWLTPQGTFAIEGEYFRFLGDQDDGYRGGGGSQIIGRPLLDVSRGVETAQLIDFDGQVSGTLNIGSSSDLRSLLINGRVGLCPVGTCNANGLYDRTDWIIGYRYLDLDESLVFHENLTSEVPNVDGTIVNSEAFRTRNEFHGLQLGVVHQAQFKRAWLESMLRVAVGNNSQQVQISGNTKITENGVTDAFGGAVYAQRTNIGNYERQELTMIPEIGLTLGVRVTDWLDATIGYTALYYPNVVRPGKQMDGSINSNLFAPETDPFSGPPRPRFHYVESDYLAHGLTLGAELRF
jgi:hypothetical protein